MMRKAKLSTKIVLLGVVVTVCFSASLVWVYFKYKSSTYDGKYREVQQVVDVISGLVAAYDARAAKGEFSLDEAKKRAMANIKTLRFNKDDYFWISDLSARMLMHPIKPDMDGKDQSDYKDSGGKKIFVEMATVCQEKGGGFIEYMWPKPGETKPSPKMSYVQLYRPWGWVIGTGIYFDELAALARVSYIILGIIILVSAGGLFLSFFMARSIARPINHIIEGLSDGADQVAAASSEVSSASQTLAEGASEQAAGLEETSASIEEMTSMTRQTAENANHANSLIVETSSVVDRANQSMIELNGSMQEISTASEETAKIIKTIDEIAFQTNLLALNAAVEAARAGEAGAGFAVVADEVRNLAMRAADAAKNTSRLIEGTVKKIRNGSETVAKTNDAFTEVATGVKKVSELVGEIAAASSEQAQGIEQINRAVSEMDKVVQQNAASAEESASASEELNAQADQMKGYVTDLVDLVGRNANGVRPGLAAPVDRKPVLAATKAAVQTRPMKKAITNRQRTTKEPSPEQVIPLEGGDFREF